MLQNHIYIFMPLGTFVMYGKRSNINIKINLKKDYSNPHEWLWRVQDFSGGSNCGVVETAGGLELEMEPEDVTEELMKSHDKALTGEELLFMMKVLR